MPREFWYTTNTASASLPYSNGLVSHTTGTPNECLRTGGGRAGPATHDDDTNVGAGFSNGAGTSWYSYNADWPAPMVAWDGYLSMGLRSRVYTQGGAGSNCWNYAYMATAGPTLAVAGMTNGPYGPAPTSYTNVGPTDISAGGNYRAGGGSFVLADFDDSTSQFPTGGWVDDGGGGNLSRTYITSIWGEISYTPPSGGFAFILGLVGLMALPMLGTLSDYRHFEDYLQWREVHHRRHTKWYDDAEKLRAWADIKAYKYPTFYFQGDARG